MFSDGGVAETGGWTRSSPVGAVALLEQLMSQNMRAVGADESSAPRLPCSSFALMWLSPKSTLWVCVTKP